LLVRDRPRLLFVAPRFLFPTDSGGKIRTTDILRGMKGGRFEIVLASPAPDNIAPFESEIESVCDRFEGWSEPARGALFPVTRMRHLLSSLPVAVATDRSATGKAAVGSLLAEKPDVVVVDFPHTAVLLPHRIDCPSVLFTHNVEAEIFERHVDLAGDGLRRGVWRDQSRKMVRFEGEACRRFDTVVAVSDRDGEVLTRRYGLKDVATIPTGVDLNRFPFRPSEDHAGKRVVFVGSMDWRANIDAMEFFMADVWPRVAAARPEATMAVVGRNPPPALVEEAKRRGLAWTFTGFVDDVRDHVYDAQVYVVPIRIGSGTRIKVFEAMAMGSPLVSTTVGVEGLPIADETHYLCADDAEGFAAAVIALLDDPNRRLALATAARHYVEENFSSERVAQIFEDICARTFERAKAA
tara:strand:+ start:1032 stop:2261 length:1230 start_codon:yes stop_codon:yes gene_type:complete